MILVSLARTWPLVLRGAATADEATRGAWPARPAELDRLGHFADAILGVVRSNVVTAFDITGWRLEETAERAAAVRNRLGRTWPRLVFDVVPSQAWAHLIGTPSPGRPFTQWPIQYLETATLTQREEAQESSP